MAIATGLVTATESRKFSKCRVFVRLVYDDLVVLGHLMIVHRGRRVYHPWETSLIKSNIIFHEHFTFFWGDSWSNLLYWL